MLADFVLSRYKDLHERTLPLFVSKMKDIGVRAYGKELNPPKWILWHMVRGEDFGLNRLVREGNQLYFANQWDKKLNVTTACVGTGMEKEEVNEINAALDLNTLDEYRKDVFAVYCKTIEEMEIRFLNEKLNTRYLHQILFEEGSFQGDVKSLFELYKEKTRGWFLLHTALTHTYYHLGQISMELKL
jgi:hypothetical protein